LPTNGAYWIWDSIWNAKYDWGQGDGTECFLKNKYSLWNWRTRTVNWFMLDKAVMVIVLVSSSFLWWITEKIHNTLIVLFVPCARTIKQESQHTPLWGISLRVPAIVQRIDPLCEVIVYQITIMQWLEQMIPRI